MIFVSVVERFILDLPLAGKMAGILWRVVNFGDEMYVHFRMQVYDCARLWIDVYYKAYFLYLCKS